MGDIITMIKTGKMTVYDSNQSYGHNTLLHIAAGCGAYDLAQFLINNGADIDAKNDKGETPLDKSREFGYPHIEKLLLFFKMNVEAGNEIQGIVEKIQRPSSRSDLKRKTILSPNG